MAIDLIEAGRVWAAEHPKVVEATTKLEVGGIQTALSSSALHHIVAMTLDVPTIRKPDDVDLLVLHEHFGRAARALGAEPRIKHARFQTGDGHQAQLQAREVLVDIGSDEVQFMDPIDPLRVGPYEYRTSYTRHAAESRTIVETDQGLLPLAHITDAIAIYAMGQRGGVKNDAYNTAVMLRADPFADSYSAERAAEMGWNLRVWDFVWAAGSGAVDLAGVAPVLPAQELVVV
jgi:hypothetical protein